MVKDLLICFGTRPEWLKVKPVVEELDKHTKKFENIKDLDIEKIDLLKLNIEGSEYDLLEKLLKSGLISTIDKLQIQFHENINESDHTGLSRLPG